MSNKKVLLLKKDGHLIRANVLKSICGAIYLIEDTQDAGLFEALQSVVAGSQVRTASWYPRWRIIEFLEDEPSSLKS